MTLKGRWILFLSIAALIIAASITVAIAKPRWFGPVIGPGLLWLATMPKKKNDLDAEIEAARKKAEEAEREKIRGGAVIDLTPGQRDELERAKQGAVSRVLDRWKKRKHLDG